jgi:betaine-aldehyde dehydrogenase
MDTLNSGKPLREARFDAADATGCFRFYAGLATKPQGQTYEVGDPNIAAETVREPIGVCGQIIPWNYPLLMASWKLAPGLAAGNCCIPSLRNSRPFGSSTFRINRRSRISPSCSTCARCGRSGGIIARASNRVDKIAFTGGTATGRKIMIAAAGNLKKISLELGGKNPNVVFADADPDVALEYAMFAVSPGKARSAALDRGCFSTANWRARFSRA